MLAVSGKRDCEADLTSAAIGFAVVGAMPMGPLLDCNFTGFADRSIGEVLLHCECKITSCRYAIGLVMVPSS
jgi:hypothetical protein